jgi:prolyl-tRNA editing enzyme YbaK/EbsC (Cys-tRNA(Pro) deacylase)
MPTIADVKAFLAIHDITVREFDRPTPTAETAALVVGCSPAEIAKTILFLVNGHPVVVVTSGDMKVKSSLLKQANALSGKVRLPAAEDVIRHTGYEPGGVCPFLLPAHLPLFLDSSLRRFPIIYPAAGNEFSGVAITFRQLQEITGGREANLCDPS